MTDDELLAAFENCTLPFEQWNHRAHVRVAYGYAAQHGFPEALNRVRAGIKAYNKATNTPEAIDRGYHETMTRAFMSLIFAANRQTGPHASSDEFCEAHPKLLTKSVLREYYSRERIMTWDAKRQFVEPDLRPLPTDAEMRARDLFEELPLSDITNDQLTEIVLKCACNALDQCLVKINHCVDQLSDEQVWWRPREEMNSIGNLLLHLTGNVRQWVVAGLGAAEDVRSRPAEFSQRGPIPKEELLAQLRQAVADAKLVLAQRTAAEMLAVRRVQGWDVTGWNAVFDCVPHFKGHTQEIIYLTRLQLGDAYTFHWQPQTPEQGAK